MSRSFLAIVGMWSLLGGCGVVPWGLTPLPLPSVVVGCVWVLSALQRAWALVVDPDLRWVLQQWECVDSAGIFGFGREGWRFLLWVVCVVLFGLALPAEAMVTAGHDGYPMDESPATTLSLVLADGGEDTRRCLVPSPEIKAPILGWEAGLSYCLKVVLVIAAWETFKRCWCNKQCRKQTALIQTEEGGIVTMPLADGVPNRAAILFSFWRAGLGVDIDPYPEEVKEEFFAMVGSRLRQLSEASS